MKCQEKYSLIRAGILYLCILILFFGSAGIIHAQTDSIEYDGLTRYYNLHIPESYNGDSVPLIIAIHGWSRDPEKMEHHSHLSDKSEEAGFIVAYPRASGNSPLTWITDDTGVDDAGFINALIDSLCNEYSVDTNRVYLTGFSNGAELVYKVAQRYGNKIAGIAPVACYWWDDVTPPVAEVPIIEFHALDDNSVKIENVQPVLNHWIDYNGCATEPDTFYVVPGAKGVRWIDETDGNDIVFFITDVGGHSWPGGESSWSRPSDAISATDLMWDFFTGELHEALPLSISDSIHHDGLDRNFNLHIPALYNTHSDSVPLFVALHGFARNPELMEYHSHFTDKAEEEDFIVVYPKGTGSPDLGWNLEDTGTDDAGFIIALIDTLLNKYRINTSLVFVTGFSNGASLSYKIAQRYGNKIAGIAPVGAYWWDNVTPPVQEIPIIAFHAIDDPYVDYSGVQPQLDNWIAFNGCSSEADTFYVDEGVHGMQWTDQSNSGNIVFFLTDIGGHSWPGGEESWSVPSDAVNATDMIWDFFMNELPEKRPDPVSALLPEEAPQLLIFPNPADSYIHLEGNITEGELRIISSDGTICKVVLIHRGKKPESIDISELPKGCYYVSLFSFNHGTISSKLIVL